MKFLGVLICLSLINGLFCALHKAKNARNLVAAKLIDKETSKAYGKIALDELNKYRKLHFFQDQIQWDDSLFDQAQTEVEQTIKKKSFGDHEKFDQYEEARKNEYFTELSVKLQLQEHEVPSKRKFSQLLLSSLTQDYKVYIVKNYSSAGIAAMHSLNDNEYLVVLHLLQKPSKYTCKQALEEGKKVKSISINVKGEPQILKCDQTSAGGGWTQIAHINQETRGQALIIPIDDRGLDYKQILFEAQPDWYLNYNWGSVNNWDFDGFNFRFNCLKFGDKWFVDASHDGYKVKYLVYNRAQDLVILKPATKCFFGGSQQLYNCAKKFYWKSIPNEGRLTAFSELQSAANVDLPNNIYKFHFKLYVR